MVEVSTPPVQPLRYTVHERALCFSSTYDVCMSGTIREVHISGTDPFFLVQPGYTPPYSTDKMRDTPIVFVS